MLAVFGNVISNYRIDQMHLLAYFFGNVERNISVKMILNF